MRTCKKCNKFYMTPFKHSKICHICNTSRNKSYYLKSYRYAENIIY